MLWRLKRVLFTFPNYTYSNGWTNQKEFFWPDQATLFSSNQCLIDRSAGHGFTKCRTARFICSVNDLSVYVHRKEKRTFEDALKQCQNINGHLCNRFSLWLIIMTHFRYTEVEWGKWISYWIWNPLNGLKTRKVIQYKLYCLIRWQWCWWHRYVGDFIMVTDFRCWWQNHYTATFFVMLVIFSMY